MQPLAPALILCLLLLLANCVPSSPPPPQIIVTPTPTPVIELNAGPYWHSQGPGSTLGDALAYYAALKTLSPDELNHEQKRLLEELEATPENRLPALQLVLLAVLPGQTLIAPDQSIKLLETARFDAELHRQLADLFILLGDQLSSHITVQAQTKQGSQTLRSTRKKLSTQAEDLTACRQERDDVTVDLTACRQNRDDLADKLQKLQNIESDLIGRGRKK